jgi:hypothetical protein
MAPPKVLPGAMDCVVQIVGYQTLDSSKPANNDAEQFFKPILDDDWTLVFPVMKFLRTKDISASKEVFRWL